MAPSHVLPVFEDVVDAHRRLAGSVRQTPVFSHPELDRRAGAQLLIKAESLQVTGSFKIRGATNRLSRIPPERRPAGVVAFSSGNLYDRSRENREEIAESLARERGAVLVPSYDDPDIIAGQGTAGLEFAQQVEALGGPLEHLICCTGGGGLVTGIALAFERLSPATRIWTAEPDGHDDWARSLAAGQRLANAPGTRSVCDAILTPEPGQLTFELGRRLLSGGLSVSDEAVFEAMRAAFRYLKIVAEPGGAVALAAALQGLPEDMRSRRVGIIVSGGNVDARQYAQILDPGAPVSI